MALSGWRNYLFKSDHQKTLYVGYSMGLQQCVYSNFKTRDDVRGIFAFGYGIAREGKL